MERARFRRQAETSDAQLVPTRPAGVLSRAPGSVGNRSADIVSQIALSTTLFPKLGFLGAEPLSVFLVTFCTSKKLPPGGCAPSLSARLPILPYDYGKRRSRRCRKTPLPFSTSLWKTSPPMGRSAGTKRSPPGFPGGPFCVTGAPAPRDSGRCRGSRCRCPPRRCGRRAAGRR